LILALAVDSGFLNVVFLDSSQWSGTLQTSFQYQRSVSPIVSPNPPDIDMAGNKSATFSPAIFIILPCFCFSLGAKGSLTLPYFWLFNFFSQTISEFLTLLHAPLRRISREVQSASLRVQNVRQFVPRSVTCGIGAVSALEAGAARYQVVPTD
jgi:hypothetical protein